MKYIVWYLISPFDGFTSTEYPTWDEAVDAVRKNIKAHFPKHWEKKFNRFLNNGKLTLFGSPGTNDFSEIFITTDALTGRKVAAWFRDKMGSKIPTT